MPFKLLEFGRNIVTYLSDFGRVKKFEGFDANKKRNEGNDCRYVKAWHFILL